MNISMALAIHMSVTNDTRSVATNLIEHYIMPEQLATACAYGCLGSVCHGCSLVDVDGWAGRAPFWPRTFFRIPDHVDERRHVGDDREAAKTTTARQHHREHALHIGSTYTMRTFREYRRASTRRRRMIILYVQEPV